jgi:hypothetical protein
MPLLSLQIHLTTMLKGQHARLKATFETVGVLPLQFEKPYNKYKMVLPVDV